MVEASPIPSPPRIRAARNSWKVCGTAAKTAEKKEEQATDKKNASAAKAVAEIPSSHGAEEAAIKETASGKLHLDFRQGEVGAKREKRAVNNRRVKAEEQTGRGGGRCNAVDRAETE